MDVERRHDSVDVDVPRIHGYPSILRSEHSACLQVSRSARLVKRSIHLIQTQKKVPPTEKRGARKDKTIRMQFTYCVSLVTPLSYDNHVLQSPIPLGSCSVFSRQCSSESRRFLTRVVNARRSCARNHNDADCVLENMLRKLCLHWTKSYPSFPMKSLMTFSSSLYAAPTMIASLPLGNLAAPAGDWNLQTLPRLEKNGTQPRSSQPDHSCISRHCSCTAGDGAL